LFWYITIPLRTHDRVLLKYLQEDEIPVKEIIDNVSQLKLDPQDMAMVVVFKEKELKSDEKVYIFFIPNILSISLNTG
jgi:hypothetical protein